MSDNTIAPERALTPFTVHQAPDDVSLHPRFDESLMQYAAEQGPAACIWQSPQGLVVPRTYLQSPEFHNVCVEFEKQGWPVSVRHSGGGVVPQGPGILNISLSYAIEGRPLDHSDTAYQHLCTLMSDAIQQFGINAHTQAVEGSFCDGRYNLAYGTTTDDARKIAGTAQLWRRQAHPDGGQSQVVLVHGLLLVATDIEMVTRQANALEQALGHSRRYLSTRAASLHELARPAVPDHEEFTRLIRNALHQALQNYQG